MSPTYDDPLYDVFTGPDSSVIADHIRSSGKKNNEKKAKDKKKKHKQKKIPEHARLTNAITGVSITDTMAGSSTLTITMVDPDYDLIDSEFFDTNEDGRLDPLDIEYPNNSGDWWRCTQIAVSHNSGVPQLTSTCMERAAAHLSQHHGPMKVARGKRTRAEFLKMCAKKVKAGGGIDFHCKEIHEKQQVGEGSVEGDGTVKRNRKKEKQEDEKKEKKQKKQKIHKEDVDLTVKGVAATPGQIRIANTGLGIAQDLGAPEKACLALLVAFIQESTMQNLNHGDRDSLGVLQVRVSTSGSATRSRDVEWCTEKFLKDGFWGKGGAISLAKKNPGQDPGWIAQQTQGSGYPEAYAPHIPEARKFLEAFGGAGLTGGGSGAKRKYNFEIGTADNPNEDIWAGMNRIAEEVKWPLFLNGQDLYYDDEMTLIKQQPALILHRGSAALITYEYNWDTRHLATEMTLDLVCEPDEFRAGQVFKLVGFGPASKSSTAHPPLPGRWLVSEIERDMASLYSSFTLKQPVKPLKEPKGEREGGATGGADSGSTDAGPLRDKIVQIAKDSVRPYFYSQGGATTTKVHPGAGNRSDCSQWARACYMTAGAPDPGTYTGAMLARGKTTSHPKPGDLLCSPTHVELFIGDGKTIGHGSDPIDYDTVAGVKGRDSSMRFITYGFLDK